MYLTLTNLCILWDLRLSQQRCWRSKCTGLWLQVAGHIVLDISKYHSKRCIWRHYDSSYVTAAHPRMLNLQLHCSGKLKSCKIWISFKAVVFDVSQIQALSRSAVCREPSEYFIQPLDLLNGILASLIVLVIGKLIYDYWSFKKTGKLPWLVSKMPWGFDTWQLK